MRPSVRIPALDTFICEKIGLFENTENKLELISHFVRGEARLNRNIFMTLSDNKSLFNSLSHHKGRGWHTVITFVCL